MASASCYLRSVVLLVLLLLSVGSFEVSSIELAAIRESNGIKTPAVAATDQPTKTSDSLYIHDRLRRLKDEAEEAADAAEDAAEEAEEAAEDALEDTEETAEVEDGNKNIYAHGSLMIAGWGLILPSGVIVAALGRHRPGGLWFKVHRFLQIAGLIIVLIAWIIALKFFDGVEVVDDEYGDLHETLGLVVMLCGLAQPLNAFIRPHAPHACDKKPPMRLLWEIVHKSLGYSSVILAVFTIILGTTLLPTATVKRTFRYVYGIGVGGFLLIMIMSLLLDKLRYKSLPAASADEMASSDLTPPPPPPPRRTG